MEFESKTNYFRVRITQTNLIYVIGLPTSFLQHTNNITSKSFFGYYGRVEKVFLNQNTYYNYRMNPLQSCSAHVTYEDELSAATAILAIDKMRINKLTVRANYGLNKFCHNFLLNKSCPKTNCSYIHNPVHEQLISNEGGTSQYKKNRIRTY